MKEKWSKGKHAGTVVSDTRSKMTVPDGRSHNDVAYYGGYLVAESIPTDEHARLIAAAPDLLEALEALFSNPYINLGDLVYTIREKELQGWDGPAVIAWSDAVMAGKAAITKARGESEGAE